MKEMNIVIVKHLDDQFDRRYTFNVPDGCKLNKGDVVMVNTKLGGRFVECMTDSHIVPEEIAEATANSKKITGNVVGKVFVEPFMANGNAGKVEIRKFSPIRY